MPKSYAVHSGKTAAAIISGALAANEQRNEELNNVDDSDDEEFKQEKPILNAKQT